MTLFADLYRGAKHHPWKTLQYVFASFSVLFTLASWIALFDPSLRLYSLSTLATATIVSAVYALWSVWKPSRIEICPANCNTAIEVLYADLFQQDGIRAIPVSTFFESKLGKPVSGKSVHGALLLRCFGGLPESFDKQLDEQLANSPSELVQKADGKLREYPVGTTALITIHKERYVLVASATVDPQTCKVHTDVMTMWNALDHLWPRLREEADGEPVNLPLIGSGMAGIGLPSRDVLNLIILSAINETKSREIARRIRVVLRREQPDNLDLREIKQYWERQRH
jgi:hypothetical protein